MTAALAQARIETVDGRKVLVFDPPSPLPPTLEGLLRGLYVTFRADVRPGGAARSCEVPEDRGNGRPEDHRLVPFREGRHVGRDGVFRYLRLLMCVDCETVCVRDVSVDRLDGLRTGRLSPRRRDTVLGWYTGARRNQRIYR